MKIKNTEIKIVQGNPKDFDSNNIVRLESKEVSEGVIRQAAAKGLSDAEGARAQKIIFPALGCGQESDFPPVGSAKIIVQEIVRHLRDGKSNLKEIIFCLESDELYRIFETNVTGYIRHIQETLGPGPYVTVDIIIELPEGIVLIERSNPPYGWALPGGFVDYGESLEEAAAREAKEETNLDLKHLRQFHTYSEPGRDPRFQTISTVFIATGVGQPQFGDDAKGLQVIAYDELLSREFAFDHKDIIRAYLQTKQ